jgi:hypothetical protein
MAWRYYENPTTGNTWRVPFRIHLPIPTQPKFVAENDAGVWIGTFGRREYLANLVYQHADCCIYFYVGAKFDLGISEIKSDFEVAGPVIVGDIYAESALTDDEKNRFLEAATDPHIYNQLFRMCEYDLLAEIRIVRTSPLTHFQLSQKPWSKNGQRN